MGNAVRLAVGAVIGLVAAYFLWGGDPRPHDDTTGGAVWPHFACPPPPSPDQGTTARDILDDVTSIALGLAKDQRTQDSIFCAVNATQVQMAQPSDEHAASARAAAAHAAAKAGDWSACRAELETIR